MAYQDPLFTVKKLLMDGKPGALGNPRNWPAVDMRSVSTDTGYFDVDLIGDIDNCISRLASEKSKAVQFPRSTAFIHAMGIFSSACVFNFNFQMKKGARHFTPPSIYVVTGQPPSSGKSPVHNAFFEALSDAFRDLKNRRVKERRALKAKLIALQNELKNQQTNQAKDLIQDDISSLEEKIRQIKVVRRFTTDDPTPEALMAIAKKNGGYFAALSDEDQVLKTLIGGQYSAAGKDPSVNVLLKGFDNGYVSNARVSDVKADDTDDDSFDDAIFQVRGAIACSAQTPAVDEIIEAGKRGVGVTERFYLLEEKPLMGTRRFAESPDEDDFCEPETQSNLGSGEHSLLDKLEIDVLNLMHNVVKAGPNTLYFEDSVHYYINRIRNAIEPNLAPGRKYGYPIIQGFMGKCERHIKGLACLLHIATEWAPDGGKSNEITLSTVKQAAELFRKLSESTIASIEARSAGSGRAEMSTVYNKFCNHVERKRMFFMTYRELRDAVKKEAAFRGIKDLTSHLREITLRRMAEQGICLPVKSGIYINPNVR